MSDYHADPEPERTPPSDMSAEQAVLGSMMSARYVIPDVIEVLRDETDFLREPHQVIYQSILDLYGAGQPVDPITVTDHLRERGELGRIGGPVYLSVCVQAVPVPASAGHYATIVRGTADLRRVLDATGRIEQIAYSGKADAAAIIDDAQGVLAAIISHGGTHTDTHVSADDEEYLDRLEHFQRDGKSIGVPTGFIDLDALTGGLLPGQVVIVAARPAMGKSTFALDILRSCAIQHGLPAVLFSLEMSRDEIKNRLYSAQARIPLHHLRQQGGMTDDDWARFAKTMPRVSDAPLHIDTDPNKTVARIQARCRALQQTTGLRLVVIDYLQLMTSGTTRRDGNRQQEVSDMTRALKVLAMELGVPVVVLSQLNRGPEQRADKKPVMSDLRESGAIEQDADIVILLHREDAYDKESPRAGEADLIVEKNRNGPTAVVTVAAQLYLSRFVDMAQT
ncbi:replicative DNA helicase [Streptomyces sp. NPDC020983]|uniref:replicative DNA helicase n=1 Tax=Streptomyces sp. NPDC020983 TaxID=3365106 RepID=UPI0037B4068B